MQDGRSSLIKSYFSVIFIIKLHLWLKWMWQRDMRSLPLFNRWKSISFSSPCRKKYLAEICIQLFVLFHKFPDIYVDLGNCQINFYLLMFLLKPLIEIYSFSFITVHWHLYYKIKRSSENLLALLPLLKVTVQLWCDLQVTCWKIFYVLICALHYWKKWILSGSDTKFSCCR